MKSKVFLCGCLFIMLNVCGQNSACQGNLGSVVLYENFGIGSGIGNSLSAGSTTYSYATEFPNEGQYTIYSNTFPGLINLPGPGESWIWHLRSFDYTSTNIWSPANMVPVPGKMMLINANHEPGVYYQQRIEGLCGNTSYEFTVGAASLYNPSSQTCSVNNGQGVPVNFKMQIWNITQTELLSEIETGNISNTNSLVFHDYSLLYTTLPGQTNVIVKIINNNTQEGCGNDLALDEIRFRVCGSEAVVSSVEYPGDEVVFCENQFPVNLTLQLDYYGSEHDFYNWQMSNDGASWTNISGASSPILNLTGITTPTYYRVKFAGSLIALQTAQNCYWVSNTFFVRALTLGQPGSWGDREYCGEGQPPPAVVMISEGVNVRWYDQPTGGNLLQNNSISYQPTGPGTYYAETYVEGTNCFHPTRTAITISWIPGVELPPNPDPIETCGGEPIELDAGISGANYQWSPNVGSTQIVTVINPGTYVVTVSNESECVSTRTFIITGYAYPEIQDIITQDSTVIIWAQSNQNFMFSLDGINWQFSNTFYNVEPGYLTAYVRDEVSCGVVTKEFLLLNPPAFFTPNGDGVNDTFKINGIERFQDMEVFIFNRYGKQLSVLNALNLYWDGTLNGSKLPSSDYWYRIDINGKTVRTGHFTLKR